MLLEANTLMIGLEELHNFTVQIVMKLNSSTFSSSYTTETSCGDNGHMGMAIGRWGGGGCMCLLYVLRTGCITEPQFLGGMGSILFIWYKCTSLSLLTKSFSVFTSLFLEYFAECNPTNSM